MYHISHHAPLVNIASTLLQNFKKPVIRNAVPYANRFQRNVQLILLIYDSETQLKTTFNRDFCNSIFQLPIYHQWRFSWRHGHSLLIPICRSSTHTTQEHLRGHQCAMAWRCPLTDPHFSMARKAAKARKPSRRHHLSSHTLSYFVNLITWVAGDCGCVITNTVITHKPTLRNISGGLFVPNGHFFACYQSGRSLFVFQPI